MSDRTILLWCLVAIMAFWTPIVILIGLAAEGRLV